jgi:hypothetical protein
MKLFPGGGFDNQAVTATPVYFEHSTDMHRSRVQRHAGDFARLRDHRLGNLSPPVNSKTAILITREVEQEHRTGELTQQSRGRGAWR